MAEIVSATKDLVLKRLAVNEVPRSGPPKVDWKTSFEDVLTLVFALLGLDR